jgi:hypothetical protein
MARTLSPEILQRIESADADTLAMQLAKVAVEAKLPVMYVASMLGLSRMTLHTWYRGGEVRESRREKIETFIALINDDIQAGVLPKDTLLETKDYAERFSGRPVAPANKLG